MGVDPSDCLDHPDSLDTARKLFERKIRYWHCRPMPEAMDRIVSPADARLVVGSFERHSMVFLKEKFFSFTSLIGKDKQHWRDAFCDGDFALFRLTPDKYHYNHVPVAGVVKDIYEISGRYHSCNPGAVVAMGLVAMIEIVAMMIGDIIQCYSKDKYNHPQDVVKGLFLQRGCPKSLYRPGSSIDILIFQKQRILFSQDIFMQKNMQRCDVSSRDTLNFQAPLVETDVLVRSEIGGKI